MLWGDVSCSGELFCSGENLLWGVKSCSGESMLLWGVNLLWGEFALGS
ncbi:MAG TPA: hypothetical protein PLB63_10575 [Planctomycetota bacterium]|nr:hypothetical protein [Planctomycetota bacterium]HQB01387.1 hypothetical protein [Planctomycetota bacterium]